MSASKIYPPVRAALIDMDGVLYDSMKYHTLAWKRLADELGLRTSRGEFYLYEGMTGVATLDMLFRRDLGRGIDPDEARRLYARKAAYFVEMGRKELMPGAQEVMAALRDAGVRRVLVTGSAQNSLLERLDTDYPGIFAPSDRITALDVSHGKPHPEPYLRGLEKAGVSPTEAIVIENAPLGVEAGKAAGCRVCAVTTGSIPPERMAEAGADFIFPSMTALAAALPSILHPTDNDTSAIHIRP